MALRREMKLRIQRPLIETSISIDATIAEKRPVSAMPIDRVPIDIGHHDFFAIDRPFGDDHTIWTADETLPPKFDPVAARRFFVANAIRRGNITTISDGMATLDRFPRRMLRRAEFLLLRWMPADSRGIENNFRSAQRREPRRFRIPLVPTDTHADLSARGLPGLEPEIARREIKFLVIQRVIGDVHLTIFAKHFSIGIE